MRYAAVATGLLVLLGASGASGQDWPQWRGPNRDAKVTGFTAPKEWPKELKQKWKVPVGDGVATPALVGDKLYVFTRQGTNEVLRCLDAGTGNELWQAKYETAGVRGPDGSFPGPRSSPAVAEGKVVTLGVNGVLSCYDAAKGEKVWQKDDLKALPNFHTASSPLIVDGLAVVMFGGEKSPGGIVAFDLASGNEKWKWAGDGAAYASPVLVTIDGAKVLVAETAKSIVAIGVSDGKLLWRLPFEVRYNAVTPIADGPTVIYAGMTKGTYAVKLEKGGDGLTAKELWANKDNSPQFSSPVLKNGLVFGITSQNNLFCINAETGKTAWTAPGPKGGGGGGRMGGGGYGSVVDAGSVLFALTPAAQLIVFEPSEKEFKQLATYKVADGGTHAYPVIAGNRIFIKDKDSVILWTME